MSTVSHHSRRHRRSVRRDGDDIHVVIGGGGKETDEGGGAEGGRGNLRPELMRGRRDAASEGGWVSLFSIISFTPGPVGPESLTLFFVCLCV